MAAALTVAVATSVVQPAGNWFRQAMEAARAEPLVTVAKVMAFLGGVWCTWIVRAVVLGVLGWRRHWLHFTAFVGAIVTSEVLISVLKGWFDRPRPAGSLVATSGAAFPSGHAVAAAVTALGLVIVLLPPGHNRWVWERRAVLYASLMALSRTYLGAHWLSDVVAGGLLGGAVAIGWPAVLVTWRRALADTVPRDEPNGVRALELEDVPDGG